MTDETVNTGDTAKRPQFGTRYLTDGSDVFSENAWDNVEWTEEVAKEAREKIEQNSRTLLSDEERNRLENNADLFWDDFYCIHQNKFFKDRHWLFTEFPELLRESEAADKFNVFEIGCGVGNTVFPLLQTNKSENLRVFCCDFSAKAIDLLKEHALYDNNRCDAFVCDATSDDWRPPFEKSSLDVILMIFTLSAIAPEKFGKVLTQAVTYLKPNGLLLFRDYGRNDLTQLRFKAGRCIRDNYYVRGDGTRVYYFDEQEIHQLFTSVGLLKQSMFVDKRLQVNRGRQLKMYRVWIQAKYRKPDGQCTQIN